MPPGVVWSQPGAAYRGVQATLMSRSCNRTRLGENPGRKSLASVGSARYISGAQVRGGEPGGADIGRNLPFDESYSLMHVLLSSDRFGLTPRGWCVSFRANMAVCVAPWPPGSVY